MKERVMQKLKEKLGTFLLILVNGSCFIFVCVICRTFVGQYLSGKATTSIRLQQSENVKLFPAITICSDPENRWNESMLKFCGIDR